RRVQRITKRMRGMGTIASVHVQASSFTYLVQATRANNAPYIAWQRSSPFLASFLLSFDPSSRRPGPRAINCRNAPPDLPGGALCFVDRSKCARSRVPTTKDPKDNKQDASDGEDRCQAT